VSLALLTVALRMLEYKLLIVDHAQELYIGAIACCLPESASGPGEVCATGSGIRH